MQRAGMIRASLRWKYTGKGDKLLPVGNRNGNSVAEQKEIIWDDGCQPH